MTQAEEVILKLTDQVTGPAAQIEASISAAAGAVREAQSAVNGASAAMGAVTVPDMGGAAASAASMGAAYDGAAASAERAAEALDDATGAAEEAASAQAETAAAVQGAGAAASGAKPDYEALAGATTILGGSMGGAAAKAINLTKFIGKLGPEAVLAIAAVLALVAAFAAFVAIAGAAISASSKQRDELLKLQGAAKGNAAAAQEMQAAITAVSSASALGRDTIAGYAAELGKAGIQGAEMQRALEAAAVAGSAGGEEMARSFLDAAKAAKATGGSVDALSAKMVDQLGGVAAAQAVSLSVQFDKLGEDLTQLFSGAKVDGFLRKLNDVTRMFSAQTRLGQQLRDVLGKAFDGLAEAGGKALPYLKQAIVGALIVSLQLYIGMVKAKNAIADMLAPVGALMGGMDGMSVAAEVGKAAMWAIVIVLGALAAIAAVVVAIVAAFYGVFYAIGAAGTWMGEQIVAAFNALRAIDLGSIATGMIDGLIAGITGSIGRVVAAASALARSTVTAMKAAIGMRSPATAFIEIGQEGMGEGVAVGAEKSETRVGGAVSDMVDPKSIKLAAKGRGGAGGMGGAKILYVEKLVLGSREVWDDFRAFMRQEFEVEALSAEVVPDGV